MSNDSDNRPWSSPGYRCRFRSRLLGRRPQGAVRPLAGGGIAQRIVLTGEADVALPPFADIVGHGRHGLAARRAQLPTRVERSHQISPAEAA